MNLILFSMGFHVKIDIYTVYTFVKILFLDIHTFLGSQMKKDEQNIGS